MDRGVNLKLVKLSVIIIVVLLGQYFSQLIGNSMNTTSGSRKSKAREPASRAVRDDSEHENLGLDADGSSGDPTIYSRLNSDNDRISGNPDGEDDQRNTKEPPGHSPLDEK